MVVCQALRFAVVQVSTFRLGPMALARVCIVQRGNAGQSRVVISRALSVVVALQFFTLVAVSPLVSWETITFRSE